MKQSILALVLFAITSGIAAAHPVAVIVGVLAEKAVEQSKGYTCKIVKTAPKPGTNYTNEKSVCSKR